MRTLNRIKQLLSSRAGETLYESLVGAALTVIVLGGAGIILYQSVHSQRNAEVTAYANSLAREKIEALKTIGYENIEVGESEETTEDGDYVILTRVVAETDPTTGNPLRVKTITVEVYANTGVDSVSGRVLASHTTSIHKRGL